MAHLGRRRDRLIVGLQRVAYAADDGDRLEGHLPDLRIIGRERVAERKIGRAVPGAQRQRLSQRAKLLEASGSALEDLELDGFRISPAADAHDDVPRLSGARGVRRGERRNRHVMRPDVHGLGDYCGAAVEGRGRKRNGVVPVGGIPVRRVATVTGRPVAERPRLRREADSTWVERLVEKLDDVEDRGVKREEAEVRDRWWRDFEA